MNQIIGLISKKKKNKKINLPTSKSILIRLLFMLLFSKKKVVIERVSICSDVFSMISCLECLGKKIAYKNSSLIIKNDVKERKKKEIFVGNSGLTARIIFMYLLFKKKKIILKGDKGIYKRPMKSIEDIYNNVLKKNRSRVLYKRDGFLPLKTFHGSLFFNIKEKTSSQFITAFLLNSHILKRKIEINIGNVVSKKYISMTIEILKKFGLKIKKKGKNSYNFKKSKLRFSKKYIVEKDCSSASYFFMLCLIEKNIFFPKKIISKTQTEVKFLNVLNKIGLNILKNKNRIFLRFKRKKVNSISIDCESIIDSSISLCLLFLSGIKKIKLYNIHNWNVKESKRIDAISKECKVFGMNVKKGINWIIFTTFKERSNIVIKNYDDHRICMTFSILLKKKNILINNPNSVKKTFPRFFDELNV
ncbi:3-phosphoshikimate 1-carboxyvinyltransferase [Candidatus Vidania fulgoroideae]|nr:3-phosphoshikimate 1-carboxyvinyltransferase [Candidatus Vidania fulgoroideae]